MPEIRTVGGVTVPTVTERRGLGHFVLGKTRVGWRRPLGSVAPPQMETKTEAEISTGLGGELEVDEGLVIGG